MKISVNINFDHIYYLAILYKKLLARYQRYLGGGIIALSE